jgi:hypothetical protein
MRPANRILLLGLAIFTMAQAGCLMLAAGAVGGSAVGLAVVSGTVTRDYDATVEATAAAAQSALQDLKLPIERPHIGATHATIDSTLEGGGAVLLTIKAVSQPVPSDPARTHVEIHVKIFGDQKISERILDQIDERLRNPGPPVITPSNPPAPPPPLPPQTAEPGLAPSK